MSEPLSLAARLHSVQAQVEQAAVKAGRGPNSVRLIAVSKGHSVEAMREVYSAGQRDFGESYVQELQRKAPLLSDLKGLCIHLIGHLQRNKARHAVKLCSIIHGVDTAELAVELAVRWRGTQGTPLSVLVEVNVGREPQKYGVLPENLEAVLHCVEQQPELQLVGLMTLPPHTLEPSGSLPYFESLRRLRDEHGGISRLPELSMGMSDDLEYAIAAGATWVRVGTAIFGPRG